MNEWLGIVGVFVCLAINAFFTGSEMALISANRLRLRHLAGSGNRRAARILTMLEHPEKFLSTTLVGINFFLVLGATISSLITARFLQDVVQPAFFPLVTTLVLLPLVIILGEIVPKSLVRLRATEISLGLYYPLMISYYLLFPLVKVVALASRGVIRLAGRDQQAEKMFDSAEEINLLMEEGERQGALTEAERKMISRVFDFGETQVDEVMVPLIDIALAPEESRVGDIRRIIARTGHTRIPIYRERVDRIIGTVQATDLLTLSDEALIEPLIRKPYIVPETKPLEEMLEEFRKNDLHLAVVVDEYGGVSGIVTLENVLEEIFGEIRDEYDLEEGELLRFRGQVAEVSGRMGLDELNEELGLRLPEDHEEETIAGFLLDLLGRIPAPGDRVNYAGHEFVVIQATDRRLVRLEIRGPSVEKALRRRSRDGE